MDPPDVLPQSVIQGRCSPVLFFDRLKNEGAPPVFAGAECVSSSTLATPEVGEEDRGRGLSRDVTSSSGGSVQRLARRECQAEGSNPGAVPQSGRVRRREERTVLRRHPVNYGAISVSFPSFLPSSRPRHRQPGGHRVEGRDSSRVFSSNHSVCWGAASDGGPTRGERQTGGDVEGHGEERKKGHPSFPPTNGRLLLAGGYGMFELWDHSIPMRSNEVRLRRAALKWRTQKREKAKLCESVQRKGCQPSLRWPPASV